MTLPVDLSDALIRELNTIPRALLIRAAEELSTRYRTSREQGSTLFMTSSAHRLAYLAVRMPATYAAVKRVLNEAKHRMPSLNPHRVADIGSGPGTASWAAKEVFSEIDDFNLYENDSELIALGKRLMQQAHEPAMRSALWHQGDILSTKFQLSDLSILSYVIGELPMEGINTLLTECWSTTVQLLVVIEPGTPHGFERIRYVRQWLIERGAFLVAPCPHHEACPMANGDWCHFSERLERSSLHMSVKDVSRRYEDEKYSYVIASKTAVNLPEARILRHPQHHSGHIDFVLCTKEGLEKRTISRRHGDQYKRARKLDWGDTLPEKT